MSERARPFGSHPQAQALPLKEAYNSMVMRIRANLSDYLLNFTAYGTVALVAIVSLFALDDLVQRLAALGLLLVFGLLCYFFDARSARMHMFVYLGLQTLVVCSL